MQMQHLAVPVAEDLHLDVLRARNVFLQEHRRIAKRPLRLALRLVEQRVEIAGLVDHPHPAPAAAKRRLDDQRKTDLRRDLQRLTAVAHRILRARQRRHLQLLRQRPRRHLVAHQLEQLRLWPHELNPRLPARPREPRILRQKSVARMNEIHAMLLRHRHDPLDVQIRADRTLPLAHAIRLVRLEAVHRKPVLLGVDRDRAQPEFRRRAHDADGDLGAVGDEEFLLAGRRRRWRGTGCRHGKKGARFYGSARDNASG